MFSCSSSIDGWKINVSQEICEEHNGIDYIDLISSIVVCNDGFMKTLEVKINEN